MMNMENEKELLISLRDITVDYGEKPILENVDLDIFRGDFMAVSGPNGGGKTTLMRVMLKLLKPTSGQVEYFHDGESAKRLRIGYLPQKSMIDTHFPISVRQTILSGLQKGFLGRMPQDYESRFDDVVRLTGTHDYLDRRIGALSGGQLQRTLLARAIISDPEVLFLDEPLSYVDKQFEHKIYSIMEELSGRSTIILVSHEMSVISRMANRHILVDHDVRQCSHCTHIGVHKSGEE